MAFSFSFFSPPSSGALPLEPEEDLANEMPEAETAVSPGLQNDSLLSRPEAELPTPPMASTGGLAALAVSQSTSGPLQPPSPRRLTGYMTPGPAIAASLALAGQASEFKSPPSLMESHPSSATAPATNHFNSMHGPQARDLAQLRLDMETEIEQVRQDLFGAAMGVSALKDRIDGLEGAPSPERVAPLSTAEIEPLIRRWLDEHLPAHLERTLDQALQQTISTLSSSEFFRLPVHPPGVSSDRLLTQPPHILSSYLS